MEAMKPCPFCGGEPHLERNHRNFVKGEQTRVALVRCTQCEAKSGKFDLRTYDPKTAQTLAIEAWNRRVSNSETDTPTLDCSAVTCAQEVLSKLEEFNERNDNCDECPFYDNECSGIAARCLSDDLLSTYRDMLEKLESIEEDK